LPIILVVEDDADINVAIQEVLRDEGYACAAALSGDEGFRLLVEEEPDLVLLDLALPRMTGMEFLVNKAAVSAVAGIPVIAMTGLTSVPKLDNIVAVLRKPFELEVMVDLVRQFAPASRWETA
jgi:DNA-binding response OmpR family regulator